MSLLQIRTNRGRRVEQLPCRIGMRRADASEPGIELEYIRREIDRARPQFTPVVCHDANRLLVSCQVRFERIRPGFARRSFRGLQKLKMSPGRKSQFLRSFLPSPFSFFF